ncbi:hypothetical protein LUZ61_012495 [Rhynchospora tenuis]|uniref:DUF674 domain-containing protein n=1 Tax=Rhynchospora tenuis TaxID=198213 RepID=A0AAD6F1H2_9POAL|nr:hypothetical protein LUZ61_012495 [Rhynchospora tenuis]
MANANSELGIKLLIDKKANKVLFGEANKDLVDFIFSLLSLPLSAVTKLLTKDDIMVGSIGQVYSSLGKLNETYILPNQKVSSLLNPILSSTINPNANFLLPPAINYGASNNRRLYVCTNRNYHYNYGCCAYVSEVNGVICPTCKASINTEAKFVNSKTVGSAVEAGSSEGKGYVKGVVTYSVMDDLTVVPMSTISSITLLNKFQIKDLGSLEEKTVGVGFDEGLKLLKASLQSKTVLTDVFLKKN